MGLARNLKWTALSQAVKISLQLISLTVLTRLLSRDEYGLMAMAAVITNFSMIIRDLGTAAAIIQRKTLTQATISAVFWLNMAMGTVLCIAIMLASHLVSAFFNEPRLTAVLLLLAFSFPIASSAATHQALLERDSHFKKIAGLEICSAAVGLMVAITMAYGGYGVYSLVGQTLVSCSLSTVLLWRASSWRPTVTFSSKELRQLFTFSGNLTAFNLINYFSRNADSMVIGYYFSAVILGAYSLAYRLMLFPLQSLTFVTTRALYPIMSRQQDDLQSSKALYLKVILGIASITAPLMFGLAVLREPFVQLVFGPQWSMVSELLLWLAPTGFIQSLVSTSGSVFMAKGKTALLMKLGLVSAMLQVSAFVIGGQYDVETLVALYLLANLLNATMAFKFVMLTLGCRLTELVTAAIAPIVSTLAMCFCLLGLNFWLEPSITWFGFIGQVLLGSMLYIVSYRIFWASTCKSVLPDSMHRVLLF